MAKKLLCIVLSMAMLLSVVAVAASAAVGDNFSYTPETAAEEMAEKLWEVEYDADVDYKDLINRTWLTGAVAGAYDPPADEAAPQEILEKNLYFWADEIIEAYNSATTNEEYWTLYNKMKTPQVVDYKYEEDGEIVVESDILYDYGYYYRDESKAVMELDIVADKEYAKAGDIITVEVYATSNFITQWFFGGIFYDKENLKPLTVSVNDSIANEWFELKASTDLAVTLDSEGAVVSDFRSDFWPIHFATEENLNKYGVSYVQTMADYQKPGYTYGVQFDNTLIFTATYEVKADVADGTALEFFVVEDSTATMDNLLYTECGSTDWGTVESIFNFYHLVYTGGSYDLEDVTVDANAYFDQTVIAETEVVTVGEEPAPEEKGEIVDVVTSETYIGDTAVVSIDVTGAPEALNVLVGDGAQRFAREDADIETTEAGEKWTIEILVNDAQVACSVVADYGELGTTDATDFVLTGLVKQDLSIHSIEIPDMYPDAQNGGMIIAGKHDIIIKTSTDVVKIQFYAEDGTTYTYTSWSGAGKMPYEDIDGERVWTISHAFGPFGYNSLVIRTRSESTFFTSTGSTLDATVVY